MKKERSASPDGDSQFFLRNSKFEIHCLFDERDLIDLTKRGPAFHHLLQRRLTKEEHPFVFRRFFDLRGRAAIENHAANTIGEVEKFRDRRAAVEAGAVAFEASRAFPEGLVAIERRSESRLDEKRVGIFHFALALLAMAAAQPLTDD